jgi:hypothetical protein
MLWQSQGVDALVEGRRPSCGCGTGDALCLCRFGPKG